MAKVTTTKWEPMARPMEGWGLQRFACAAPDPGVAFTVDEDEWELREGVLYRTIHRVTLADGTS